MKEDSFLRIAEEIKNNKRFIVTSHINPEGDAIGSVIALSLALKALKKDVTAFINDPIPKVCSFLPGVENITNNLIQNSFYDVAFILDCGDIDRVGKKFIKLIDIGKIINIDHHLTNNNFAHISIIDPKSSSTGELIYKLLKRLPINIDNDIAINIFAF